eukprot:m.363534 g.363534  ORF g.363534 m.363534 type:complete len:237 (+) comp20802_c0_seq4:1188-1898(+)
MIELVLNFQVHGRILFQLAIVCASWLSMFLSFHTGMLLQGVREQSDIGYLTILEALHYVNVGTFLKSPRYPIWLIGSETHFSVVFSVDNRLAVDASLVDENVVDKAKRVFLAKDGTGGGFISAADLPGVLAELGFDKSPADVASLAARMGGDIILLTQFLDVLYPNATDGSADVPSDFVIYHYNGIASPGTGAVTYARGVAKTVSPRDFGTLPIMKVLRTKWNPLDCEWDRDDVKI